MQQTTAAGLEQDSESELWWTGPIGANHPLGLLGLASEDIGCFGAMVHEVIMITGPQSDAMAKRDNPR
jgi:hypothetical protein